MNNDNKELIIALIVDTLKKHPDWLHDILYAMQLGVTEALQDERTKTSDLAYSFSVLVDVCPKQTQKNKTTMMKGLVQLQSFFSGSKFGDKLQEIINE
jgi:hypothetical protein